MKSALKTFVPGALALLLLFPVAAQANTGSHSPGILNDHPCRFDFQERLIQRPGKQQPRTAALPRRCVHCRCLDRSGATLPRPQSCRWRLHLDLLLLPHAPLPCPSSSKLRLLPRCARAVEAAAVDTAPRQCGRGSAAVRGSVSAAIYILPGYHSRLLSRTVCDN